MIAVRRRAQSPEARDAEASAPLEVRDVHRNFGAVAALRGITVSLGQPGVTGIIGPNGSGKTTLVNVITGILHPSSGRIVWHGRNIARCRPHVISELGITRTFQQSMTFPRLSVEENLVIALEAAGRSLEDLEEFLSADSPFPALGGYRGQQAGEIPFGIGRLLGVTLAIVRRPQLVVLDEPAAGLNNVESAALAEGIQTLAARGASLAVIDHDMSFLLPLCQRLVVLDAGELIADGPPEQVRHDPNVISTYLGEGFVDA
jgi:branched-chain amino acid transport system ATP-binding protein